jgi:hypothetical protein
MGELALSVLCPYFQLLPIERAAQKQKAQEAAAGWVWILLGFCLGSSWDRGGCAEGGGVCFGMWITVPGPVSRDQWSEETDEEEDEEIFPESGPRKDGETDGSLQINVDEEEHFVLPSSGDMEQDILPA